MHDKALTPADPFPRLWEEFCAYFFAPRDADVVPAPEGHHSDRDAREDEEDDR